jgi:hypothetical protein
VQSLAVKLTGLVAILQTSCKGARVECNLHTSLQNMCIKLCVTLFGLSPLVQSRKHGEIFERNI